MDSISRVFCAIRHEPKAPIPRGELVLDPAFVTNYLRWQDRGHDTERMSHVERVLECCRSLRFDMVCLQSDALVQAEPSYKKTKTDIQRFANRAIFVFWIIDGAFQSIMERCGPMTLLLDIARSPECVGESLRHQSDQVIANISRGIDAGTHGIIIADDIAFHRSTYMSPEFVERYLLPLWQRQIATARESGVPVFFHSDGCLNAVLPHIVEAGFDGLQCLEPAAGMDLCAIKKTYGKDLCLMGNIDPALLSKPIDQIDSGKNYDRLRHAVENLLACAGADGGFIFGTCSGLHSGMSPELVQFMYDMVAWADPK